jgi:NAD(P)-dependent dehydrogenase (short-subunit alcohol dehydrogenase family)
MSIRAMNFARTHHLLLSVKGGGHNVAGNAVSYRGLMIDCRPCAESVSIRPHARTRLFNEEAIDAVQKTRSLIGELGTPRLGDPASSRPEHVAARVVWLATDAAANVNGRTFLVGAGVVGICPEPVPERAIAREGGWNLDALDRFAPEQLTANLRNEFAGVR